jgi:hypothetical protein
MIHCNRVYEAVKYSTRPCSPICPCGLVEMMRWLASLNFKDNVEVKTGCVTLLVSAGTRVRLWSRFDGEFQVEWLNRELVSLFLTVRGPAKRTPPLQRKSQFGLV